MSQSLFQKLAIAAAISVVIAFLVGSADGKANFDESGQRDLVTALNTEDVGSIEIVAPKPGAEDGTTQKVRLERVGRDEFAVASKFNYPASTAELNRLVQSCIDIRTTALITDDAGDHADLGLADDSATRQSVTFFDREGKPILGVLASAAAGPGGPGSGFHVRLAGEDRAYKTDAYLSFRSDSMAYVVKDLLQVAREDTAKVTVQNAGGEYTIVSPEAGTVELQGIPEGKQAKGTDYEQVFGAASRLSFTEFQSAAEAKGLEFDEAYTVEDRSHIQHTIEIARKEEPAASEDADPTVRYFVQVSAKYVGPSELSLPEDASQEELERIDAMRTAPDTCARFNQRHQSWVYEISSYAGGNLVKPLGDLLEDDDGLPSEVGASHILIAWEGSERSEVTGRTKDEARARAEEVLAKVQAGGDFAALAGEYSDGPSKTTGGDLGVFPFGQMAKPFSEAAFALEVGGMSGIVETNFGFHIIQRTK